MAITIGTVTINKNIEHTSDFWKERINQKSQRSTTGEIFTFDNSRTILRGVLELRYVDKAEADALRDLITNTIRFGRFDFDIVPEAFNDLGLGDGVTITDARFDGDTTTQDVIKPIGKAYKFNISFPYYKALDPTQGAADHEGVVS